MTSIDLELACFWTALVGYSLATAMAMYDLVFRRPPRRLLLAVMLVAWLLHTAAIGARWERLGHLPFINTFEMLSANVWGLMGAVVFAYWLLPRLRTVASLLLPVVMLITAWMLLIPKQDSMLPATYYTVWLYIHIGFIKLFLGSAFVALGIAGVILLRSAGLGANRFARLPHDRALDATAYRCMALALVFDTLGIVSGSIWAQDAWGRYWSWDPLEVWSLVTWLSIGLMLHVRATFRPPVQANALLVVATFVIAFFTFFGIPFVSETLHKGQI